MAIWTLSDLHLSLSNPSKDMAFFGQSWERYMEKIQSNWIEVVHPEDLVLIPGDISWAMTLEEAKLDLEWIDRLPGTKLLLKGNHDYWWASSNKMKQALPSSIHFIHNDVFNFGNVSIGGSRLWDTQEYEFSSFIEYRENPKEKKSKSDPLADQRLFEKELERLRLSLKQLNPNAALKIAMTHYPPIGANMTPSLASAILEEFKVDICVFGHLHSIRTNSLSFGLLNGVRYIFASCDYVDFKPILLKP